MILAWSIFLTDTKFKHLSDSSECKTIALRRAVDREADDSPATQDHEGAYSLISLVWGLM